MESVVTKQLSMVARVWGWVRTQAMDDPAADRLLATLAEQVARLDMLAALRTTRGQTLRRAQTSFEQAEREVRVWVLARPTTPIAPVGRPVGRGRIPTPAVIRAGWTMLAEGRRLGAGVVQMAEVDLAVLGDLLGRYDIAMRTVLHRRLELVSSEVELERETAVTVELLSTLDQAVCRQFQHDPGRLLAWASARRLGPGTGPELPSAA